MKRNNSNEWVRYLDNKSNCYYWYSNKTGETYWDEENNQDNDNNNNNQDNNNQDEQEEEEVVEEDDIHLTNIRNPHAQDYSDEDDDDFDDDGGGDDIEEQKNHQYNNKNNSNDNYSDDDNEDDENYSDGDDENEQLISNLIQKDILFRTQQDITFFTYCFIIHALVIEAPLCIIESFIRSFIFFILSLFYLFIFILSFPLSLLIQNITKSPNYPNNNNDTTATTATTTATTTKSSLPSLLYISIFLFIESLISFSLGLSFIIPGIILIIYRDFNGIDEWKLHPIPSIMGWIDPRRLAVITLGQGSSANNSSVQWKLISSSNNISSIFISEKKVEIMDSIKFNIYQNESTIFHQPFCFPRDILSFLRSNRP